MSQPKKDWSLARDKIEAEGCCRVCGSTRDLQAAHTIGQTEQDIDQTGPRGGRTKLVPTNAVIPLCGPFSGNNCHMRYDHRELDILGYLYLDEELEAVKAAGGIENARKRLYPTAYKKTKERV